MFEMRGHPALPRDRPACRCGSCVIDLVVFVRYSGVVWGGGGLPPFVKTEILFFIRFVAVTSPSIVYKMRLFRHFFQGVTR